MLRGGWFPDELPENVWSAAGLQAKSEWPIERSAQMYSAFDWRQIRSPGHDELRCVLFLINGTVMEDHFREEVSSTPLGTVRSSSLSSADLGGTLSRRSGAVKWERDFALPSRT